MSRYYYGVWNGKEKICGIYLKKRIEGLSLIMPIKSANGIKMIEFPIGYRCVRLHNGQLDSEFIIDVRHKSKRQIDLLLASGTKETS